jgi:hypothetical protein
MSDAIARVPSPTPTAPESTCHLPRRGICNQSSTRGERRPVPHHFERVGSQITGCSNLYPGSSCSSSLCPVSLLTRKPKKAQMPNTSKQAS